MYNRSSAGRRVKDGAQRPGSATTDGACNSSQVLSTGSMLEHRASRSFYHNIIGHLYN